MRCEKAVLYMTNTKRVVERNNSHKNGLQVYAEMLAEIRELQGVQAVTYLHEKILATPCGVFTVQNISYSI